MRQDRIVQAHSRWSTGSSASSEHQFNDCPWTPDQTKSFGSIGTGERYFLQSSTTAPNPSLCDGTPTRTRGLEASAKKLVRKPNGWKRFPRSKERRWSERSKGHWFSNLLFEHFASRNLFESAFVPWNFRDSLRIFYDPSVRVSNLFLNLAKFSKF